MSTQMQPRKYRERLFTEEVLTNPPDYIKRLEAKALHEDGIPELFRDTVWMSELIATLAPGRYTAKQVFNAWWIVCKRPRYYGQEFKQFVLDNKLGNIRLIGKRTDGSLEYEIFVTPACQPSRFNH